MSTKRVVGFLLALYAGVVEPDADDEGRHEVHAVRGVKEGETVLISTDTNKMRIAEALGVRPTRWGRPQSSS